MNTQGYQDLIGYYRDVFDAGDPWGSNMDALFDVCIGMYERGFEVPAELEFRPSILGSELDPEECYMYDAIMQATEEDLQRFALILNRYDNQLRRKGYDY